MDAIEEKERGVEEGWRQREPPADLGNSPHQER